MNRTPELRLIHGSRDIIEELERLLEQARAGDIVMLISSTVDREHVQKWTWAYREGEPFAWARMVAMAQAIMHDLMSDGL